MPFKKGQSGNKKGRPNGAENKTTVELKTWIQALIDNNRVQLEADLKALEPKERWQIIERLMQYTTPKMQTTEVDLNIEKMSDAELDLIISKLLKTKQ